MAIKRQILSFMLLPVCFAGVSQTYNQWLDLAGVHIEGNRFDSAAVALQRAMALDPSNENNPVLLLNLGILQRQSGLYDDAFISLTASMANNPLAEAALYNRASLLCDMERFDEAMDDYNTLIRNYPESVEAYYRRGLLFLEKNDRAAAEADFKASEAIDRENVYTKLSRALLCKLDDDWEGAERIYTELIQSSSSTAVDPGFYMGRAECYVNTEQLFKASADLRVVEKSQRENPYFHILRGRVRLGQFDKVAARADFRTALELGYDAGIVADWLKKTE